MKSTATSKGIRVLVVADQPIVRAGLKATLEGNTATVFVGEASTTKEAIGKARRLAPDVFLLGAGASEPSEVEIIQSLRDRVPEARILVLGADDDAGTILRLLRAGAHGYSPKTASTAELIRATKAVFKAEVYLSPAIAEKVLEAGDSAVTPIQGELAEQKLSPRESQVLRLIARGLTNRQIAAELGISARTVETHRKHIMTKLDIHTVAGLTRYAIERGVKLNSN